MRRKTSQSHGKASVAVVAGSQNTRGANAGAISRIMVKESLSDSWIWRIRKMKTITLQVPEPHLDLIDQLIRENLYANRNDAIRQAIRDLLKLHGKL